MDLEAILSEGRQRKLCYRLYVESKKTQMNLFVKQKQIYRYQKQAYGYQRENVVGRDKSGTWDEHIHTHIHKR